MVTAYVYVPFKSASGGPLQGGEKNGASLSHCKYSEKSMTKLRGN